MFRVPESAIGYWAHRFVEHGVAHEGPAKRFGETVLPFKDPDGMRLLLAGVPDIESEAAWSGGGVPAEAAIRGFHGVSLLLAEAEATGAVLSGVLGFKELAREGSFVRFKAEGTPLGAIVDIRVAGEFLPARAGAGSVHHIAFRAADDDTQAGMVETLIRDHRITPTKQIDRTYFRSVYFREPGGVLFEIATDQPGFAVDEPADQLGQSLKLPAMYEGRRKEIEAALPELD
jgi:glyoxalase family protein